MSGYSKLAKKPVPIPSGVKLIVDGGFVIAEFEGRKGSLRSTSDVELKISDGFFEVIPSKNIRNYAMVGTFVANLKNLVNDVKSPYSLSLSLIGVGFKAFSVEGDIIAFSVNYSHLVAFKIPKDVICVIKDVTEVQLSGFKNVVTAFADDVCKSSPWDPCLQSGIVVKGSFLRKKEGKKK